MKGPARHARFFCQPHIHSLPSTASAARPSEALRILVSLEEKRQAVCPKVAIRATSDDGIRPC